MVVIDIGVVGCVVFSFDVLWVYLMNIVVDLDFKGCGIGCYLIWVVEGNVWMVGC